MIIVQISDFHIIPDGALAYEVADTIDALKKTINYINSLSTPPDVVIVTGDIADRGRKESYRLAQEILSQLKSPFYMIPGNHDHKDNLAEVFSNHQYLHNRVHENGVDYICYSVDDFPVRIIGLDTSTPGAHGGGLGDKRLQWLDGKLAENTKRPTMVFTHHPPFASGFGHMDLEPFVSRKEFRQIIEKHPHVERVSCGHIHRAASMQFGNTIATTCPGVGMQIPIYLSPAAPSEFTLEPPGFLAHYLHNIWEDNPKIITHVGTVADHAEQYSEYPFFDFVSPS